MSGAALIAAVECVCVCVCGAASIAEVEEVGVCVHNCVGVEVRL